MDGYADYFRKIGKKPVIGRDTPNFIANRVGVYAMMKVLPPDATVLSDPGTSCPYYSAYYQQPKEGRYFITNRAHGEHPSLENLAVGKGYPCRRLGRPCPHFGVFQSFARAALGPDPPARGTAWLGDGLAVAETGELGLFVGCLPLFDRYFEDLGVETVVFEDAFDEYTLHDRAAPLPDTPIDEDDCAALMFVPLSGKKPRFCIDQGFMRAYLTKATCRNKTDARTVQVHNRLCTERITVEHPDHAARIENSI